ncbi:hypothetical protein EK904_007180, partial [Melospiza melodia maxima]
RNDYVTNYLEPKRVGSWRNLTAQFPDAPARASLLLLQMWNRFETVFVGTGNKTTWTSFLALKIICCDKLGPFMF